MLRLGALAAAGLMAVAGGAWGQAVTLEPSAAQRCLTGPGEPEYPFAAWKKDQKATVEARLRFDAPDRAPAVEVRAQPGAEAAADFEIAVKAHVARLRVPCMPVGGAPVRLTQIYEFRPDDRRVHWSRPADDDDAARRAALACQALPPPPDYPIGAAREQVQGIVIGVARYEAPDRPPTVTLHARRHAAALRAAVSRYLAATRVPCLQGVPLVTATTFVFRLGDAVYGFKPMTLRQLLGSLRDLKRSGLMLDTRLMGCPFDLRFQFRRPDLPNLVGEIGATDPSRRPLIEFLEGADIDAGERTLDAIYGDTTTLTVPCLNIAIQPQEKTS